MLVTIRINPFWAFPVQICKDIIMPYTRGGFSVQWKASIIHRFNYFHLYNKRPFPYEDTLLFVYLRSLTVQTFSVYLTKKNGFYCHLGIPAVIVGLVAAIRPSSYDMGKSFYKNIICGPLKIPGKIERTR